MAQRTGYRGGIDPDTSVGRCVAIGLFRHIEKSEVDVASDRVLVGGRCALRVIPMGGQIKIGLLSRFHQVVPPLRITEAHTRYRKKHKANHADPAQLSPDIAVYRTRCTLNLGVLTKMSMQKSPKSYVCDTCFENTNRPLSNKLIPRRPRKAETCNVDPLWWPGGYPDQPL